MAMPLAAFTARARRVRLMLFDVDAVLTDCSVTMGEAGETKTFSIRDGAALRWAKQSALEVGFVIARPSRAITAEEAAYMGDDLADLGVIAQVGLSAAPSDAAPDVTARAHWVSSQPGGRGAVREFIEVVLRARNQWDAIVARQLE